MKPPAPVPASLGPQTELGLPPAAAERLRETMSVALQFANTAALPDLGLSPTLDTPVEEGVLPRTVPPGPPATALSGQVGPYRIVRPVGAGGMGAVYEAIDTRSGARVAVKSLLRIGPAELHRFKYEFRSMAEVAHPNLVTLYELQSQGDLWLIAMEFVAGVDLCTAIRALAGVKDRDQRLRGLVRQLALGVAALHERGLLHRDLKPSNVLVTPAGRVVILDFGLVAEIARGGLHGDMAVGTPLYMSPEQCAGQLASPASDWYAVGVMLYEALTGKLPFSGGYAQIFFAKQCEEPEPPHGPLLPDDLGPLIGELLRRDPERRASGARLLAWCGGAAPRTAAPAGAVLFGRTAELEVLEDALAAAARGRTACVYLRGEAGVGKSGLVHGFIAALQARGDVTVLSGRCYQHESVPFKAFDSLVDALADHLAALAPDALAPLLGAHTGELARLFPVLQRVPAVHELAQGTRPGASEQESRRKGFAALKRLLAALAARRRLVLVLDDLHWTDADSVRLLAELLAPPDAPALLLIAAYRADWPGSPLVLPEFERLQLRVWPELHVARLDVGRLGGRDAHAAAAALLAAADLPADRWAAAIAAAARGDSLVLELLVAELAARRDELAGQDPKDLSFERWLSEHVASLAEADRAALELLAVAGAPLPVALLARALGDPSDLHARLARLHAARLVQLGRHGRAPAAQPLHDRVAAVVVAAIGPDRVRAAHRLLADTAVRLGAPDPELLARHLFAAGDRERAATYAEQAAEQAAAALAFARAAELRGLALRCTPDAWPRLVACARALAEAGLGLEAAPLFLRAAELAPPAHRFAPRLAACEQLFAAGETARGLDVLGDLLAGTDLRAPDGDEALAAGFPREVVAALEPVRSVSPPDPRGCALSDALWAACKGFFIHSPVRAAHFAARSAALAGAAGDPARRARGLVIVRAIVALFADAPTLARLRREIDAYLAAHDDPYIVGLSVIMDGISAVGRGRWSEALRDLEFGTAHLRRRCTGVAWECNFGALMTMSLLESRGELRAIALRSAVMREQARQTGDTMVEFVAAYYGALVLLAADAPAAARDLVASAAGLGHVAAASAAGVRAAMIQALCALYVGDPAAAWAEVERALAVQSAAPAAFTRNQHANLRALHGQVASAMAERSSGDARAALLATVAADAEALRAAATPAAAAHAALLDAALAALAGAPRPAVIAALTDAAAACDAADMPLAAAVARHRLGCWRGDPEGEALFIRSEAFMRLQAIACPARWVAIAAPALTPPA